MDTESLKMGNMTRTYLDPETGKPVTREMTPEEIAQIPKEGNNEIG